MTDIKTIMAATTPSEGWVALLRSGELQKVFPELYALTHTVKDGHKNIFWHTMQVLDNVAAYTNDFTVRMASLLHDIGKIDARKIDARGRCTFDGHETIGAKMVRPIFERFGLTESDGLNDVQQLVSMHMIIGGIIRDGMSDRAVMRLRGKAGKLIKSLVLLSLCDVTTADRRLRDSIKHGINALIRRLRAMEDDEQRPDLTEDEFNSIFDESEEVYDGEADPYRYGELKRIVVKSKGAGKGKLYDFRWEWNDYKGFIRCLRADAPIWYARIRLYYMRKFALCGNIDVKTYRNSVKEIRYRYGLSKAATAPFMSLAQ